MCNLCEKYLCSGDSLKGDFSTRACKTTTHPSHAFHQHERSERHICLENKTIGSDSAEMTDTLAVSKAQNINRQ